MNAPNTKRALRPGEFDELAKIINACHVVRAAFALSYTATKAGRGAVRYGIMWKSVATGVIGSDGRLVAFCLKTIDEP